MELDAKFYDCRAGNFVWYFHKLGTGASLLDWKINGNITKKIVVIGR